MVRTTQVKRRQRFRLSFKEFARGEMVTSGCVMECQNRGKLTEVILHHLEREANCMEWRRLMQMNRSTYQTHSMEDQGSAGFRSTLVLD